LHLPTDLVVKGAHLLFQFIFVDFRAHACTSL
jgi:hypothetical protein